MFHAEAQRCERIAQSRNIVRPIHEAPDYIRQERSQIAASGAVSTSALFRAFRAYIYSEIPTPRLRVNLLSAERPCGSQSY